jgi:hypothetical protein
VSRCSYGLLCMSKEELTARRYSPLGGRHAAVIPALPEELEGHIVPTHAHADSSQERDVPMRPASASTEAPLSGTGTRRSRRDSRASIGSVEHGDDERRLASHSPALMRDGPSGRSPMHQGPEAGRAPPASFASIMNAYSAERA